MTELELRITQMEATAAKLGRAARRDRVITIGTVAMVGLLAIGGATARPEVVDEITTQRLIITSSKGEKRISLEILPDGSPSFRMTDSLGKDAFSLGTFDDGRRHLAVYDAEGSRKISLDVSRTGPSLALGRITESPSLFLTDLVVGGPRIALRDEQSKTRLAASIGQGGAPSLRLADANDKAAVWMATAADDTGIIAMTDPNGKIRASMTVDRDAGPLLMLNDSQEVSRVLLGSAKLSGAEGVSVTFPESSILLFDKDRKVLWRAPTSK